MSPKLFIIFLEHAVKTFRWEEKDIKSDGERLNNLRVADDIILITDVLGDTTNMLQQLHRT